MDQSPAFIDFDDGEDEQISVQFDKLGQQYSKRSANDKYASKQMQKNFLQANQSENWFQNYEQLKKGHENKDQFYTPTHNRKRRIEKKLTPLNYQPKVQQIYLPQDRVNDQQNDQEQSSYKQQIYQKQQNQEGDLELRNNIVQETEQQQVPKKIQLNTLRRKKKRQQIARKNSEQEEDKQQNKLNEIEEKKQADNQLSQQKVQQTQYTSKNPETMIVNLNKFLNNSLPQQRIVRLTILRASSFIGHSHEYDISFNFDNRYILTAKKVSNSHLVTINFSTKKSDLQENGPFYVGKIKGNFMGTVFNILSPGLSPQNAVKLPTQRREVLATVVYSSEYFSGSKPRQFRAYVKNPKANYLELSGVSKTSEPGLDELYTIEENRKYISSYRNRKPVWRQDLQGYSLNFRGRVNQPSIKNFIMEINDPENEKETEQILLFGRVSDNKFNLDISAPLSPLIGIGIGLTSFYTA